MKEGRLWRRAAAFALIGAALLFWFVRGREEPPRVLSYPEFWRMAEDGEIDSVSLGDGEDWRVETKGGETALTPNPRVEDGKERLLRLGIRVTEERNAAPGLLLLLLAGAAAFALLRGRAAGGAAGLAKYAALQADRTIPEITFRDVIASPETLEGMRDLVGFLRSPGAYARLGARPPRGVMLYGPPGTGKTMLARALAGEAKAPFFAVSGADFVQVYVGVGASRVRELFRKARKAGGGVIFIDEIDAIGKKRDSGNDEREQTLNALLTEMSGFSGLDRIMVVAATNRLDTIDAALLREGRFDRHIEVGLPDAAQRLEILRVHARNKPIGCGVSLPDLAAQTALFSGAQLESLLNEAAIRAARRGADTIGPGDIEKAFCAAAAGDERPTPMTAEEKAVTAWHEAGHAVVTHALLPEDRIAYLTVIPSSRGAAGYTLSIQPDRLLHTRRELIARIAQALGGRAAEEMLLGKDGVTTGAAGDLQRARQIASAMAEEWDMGAGDPREAGRAILEEGYAAARACLAQKKNALMRLAGALEEKETLREGEILEALDTED